MTPEPTSQQKQQGLRYTGQPVPDVAQHTCERGAKAVPGTERDTEATSSQRTCPRPHSLELSAGRRVGKKPAGTRAPAGMPQAEDGVAVPRPLQGSLPPETRQGPQGQGPLSQPGVPAPPSSQARGAQQATSGPGPPQMPQAWD